MAGRPSVTTAGATISYHSLDALDEALYNGLTRQYERNAFLAAIGDRLAQITAGSE